MPGTAFPTIQTGFAIASVNLHLFHIMTDKPIETLSANTTGTDGLRDFHTLCQSQI